MTEYIVVGAITGGVVGFLYSAVLRRIHWENGYAIGERVGHDLGIADAQIMANKSTQDKQSG